MNRLKHYKYGLMSIMLLATMPVQAASTLTPSAEPTPLTTTQMTMTEPSTAQADPDLALSIDNTLAAQMQPSNQALSDANQELLGRNAKLQRQVNDLQTQVNVLVYESKGQLFLYGAFTVLISLLVGIFISWLVFVRRERW
ncbi:hypothetical protein [Psychrobacter sp. DM8]|uniref:hypothetical protein n=1 Tax=unclassified Psychrobacter TaxID=196806 RepID=UPI003F5096BD